MEERIDKPILTEQSKWKWISVGLTVVVAGLLTLWGIYSIREYGVALFILTPLFVGAGSVILYGLKREINFNQAWQTGFLALAIYAVGLFLCAIEGLICIIMAAPIGILLTWVGSLIGYLIISNRQDSAPTTLVILIGIIPITAFVEKSNEPALQAVVTSLEIHADPQTVWQNVVEFPQLEEPTEFLFQTGIAYPVSARIEGTGVGAVRHCQFTTGSFVEPITVWDEPRLLQFDVLDQPEPMKEISFWDIDAPHLHDYFVSKQGQFKLTKLSNGNTLLEGTTWYYHNIKPALYWRIWSDYIIHKIHARVLEHIQKNAEHVIPE